MQKNLKEVAQVFFKLGCIAFGGPAAHVAMMQEEIIDKRKWMSTEHFLDIFGATNLIPGPNSTEMTMHCGYERAGKLGLFVAGACFIIPAVVITGFLAFLYVEYGQLPHIKPFVDGIKPAVLAVILSAIMKLGKKAIKNVELAVIGTLAVVLSLVGINEILSLLLSGVIGALYFYIKSIDRSKTLSFYPLFAGFAFKSVNFKILLTFLKVGSILYGSGYVLFAYLDAELVTKGLLSRPELIDAIAIGQFTPGPVLSTATFIGYQLGGIQGAIAASVGIFLPSFLFVLFLNPLIPKMRKSKPLSYFLNSVNVAAVGIMMVVLFNMGKDVLTSWQPITICLLSLFCYFKFKKVNSMWIILGGSILGYLLSFS